MGYIISKPRPIRRVQPPTCDKCNREPWLCPSCGDYQCACIAPWLLRPNAKKGPGRLIRVHYDKTGRPYSPGFIDGFVPPTDDADDDIESIMAEPFAT